ncbi:MAG: hypothetical protein MI921_09445, partial [Cytophagales bacterium]|nr:hypothetical protein [Cytophagales bacterium]
MNKKVRFGLTLAMLCNLSTIPLVVVANFNNHNSNSNCAPDLWVENFNDLKKGTTKDNGATGWSRNISGTILNNDDHVEVRNREFSFNDTDGEAVWLSELIDISNYTDLFVSVDLKATGSLEDNDYIRVYYKLNGGAETLLQNGAQVNFFDPVVAINALPLSGNTLQIIVRAKNSANNEFYTFDNVRVFSEALIPPDVSAGGGNLSCDATTINLTASSSTPGVTYSWTGPGGFVSTEQNPGVSVAGQYVVTVTNPVNGCFSKKTVAVTNNDGQPIWVEAFDLSDGTSLDTGSTAWSTQITPIENVGAAGPTFFEVRSGEFYVFNLDGE